MRKLLLLNLFITFLILSVKGQDHHKRYESIDVLTYRFEIDLNDSSDVIQGITEIEIAFRKDVEQFQLDLSYNPADSSGMRVKQITEDGRDIPSVSISR